MLELWPHQKTALERARHQPHLALFFEAGVGKTATMINILREDYNLHKRIRRTLVFAPITVCPQWKKEFPRFSKITDDKVSVLTGPGPKRFKELIEKKPLIVVTNYESVQIKDFYMALLQWSPEIVILDEAHRVKDSESKRAKKIYPLCHAAHRRFILTGTPILNSLLDIFGQFKALDPAIFGGGFWSFRSKYFYDRNAGKQFSFREWTPHKESARIIGERIKAASVQGKRDDCLALPPLQKIGVPIQITGEQLKAYTEMKKEFVTEVQGMVSSSEFEMVKTLRMQQILAGFIQPDEKEEPIWFKDQPRLDALMEKIDEIGKEKAIIWTVFKPTYAEIGKRLKAAGYEYRFLTGEQNQNEKNQSIEDFCRGNAQFLIANPAAGSEGINLQEAKYAFYYMRGYNLLHYLQSLARNYRGGTEKLHSSVAHFHIYAKGTLDEVIAYALNHKKSIGDTVLKWSKGEMIEDLELDLTMSSHESSVS